jgi:hypothetical protein
VTLLTDTRFHGESKSIITISKEKHIFVFKLGQKDYAKNRATESGKRL